MSKKKPKLTKQYKAFLKPFLKRFFSRIVGIFIISIMYGFIQIAAAYYSKPLIDYITNKQSGFTYLFILTPALFILSAGFNFSLNLITNVIANSVTNMARFALVKKITQKPSITDSVAQAELINIAANDSGEVVLGAVVFYPWFISGFASITLTLFMMFYYSWLAGLITLLTFPIFLLLSIVFSSKSAQFQERTSKSYADIRSILLSGVEGAYYIKRMDAEGYLIKKQQRFMKTHKKNTMSLRRYENLNRVIINFLLSLFPLFIFALTLATAVSGFGSISNSMLLFVLASNILLPLQLMQNAIGLKLASKMLYSRVSTINDYIDKKDNKHNMASELKIKQVDSLRINIKAFKYSQLNEVSDGKKRKKDNDEKILLKDFSFELNRGEFGAIMGESGSGKSTILKFLSLEQTLPAECGTIEINGQNIYDIFDRSYFNTMQYVPQTHYLFKDTLRGNLALGRRFDVQELNEAVSYAILEDFVEEYTLDREIEEGSKNISGGQLQRICLARAFLRKPSLLILDEPTSALDTSTAAKLVTKLKEYAKNNNCAVLVVTHRHEMADCAEKVVSL